MAFAYVIFRKRLKNAREDIEGIEREFAREVAMYRSNNPCREQVREWLRQEVAQHRPPPDPWEIRRQLGWDLVDTEYDDRCVRGLLDD
jgi:hypothetical protein